MKITSQKCILDKAQYFEQDEIKISLGKKYSNIEVMVSNLEYPVQCTWRLKGNSIIISPLPIGGYGVEIKTKEDIFECAFDVVSKDKFAIRYGFLSDFQSEDDDTLDVEWMKDLHINTIQYYDWMYRHDKLISDNDLYADPMGRETSLPVIKKKIEKADSLGIRSFAYGAIYAATKDTAHLHPEWCMYTMDRQPLTFANWLYYMNVSENNGWTEYIVNEFCNTVKYGFTGIHMDTYGFPKHVWDFSGNPVDLENEFPLMINRAAGAVKKVNPRAGVIFNAVNNWPVRTVAKSGQDAVYIEVWPPHDTFYDLYTLIREAREMSCGNNVILAAYLHPFANGDTPAAERSFFLTWATICASGGTQLVAGEYKSLLCDSYYAKYARISDSFAIDVKRYCDYLVRYNALLYNDTGTDISKTASDGINEDIIFVSDSDVFSTDGRSNSVFTIIRESSKLLTINLVNYLGIDNRWNTPKEQNTPSKDFKIQIRFDRAVDGFYCASPDNSSLAPIELKYTERNTDAGRIYEVSVPSIKYWTTVWAHVTERSR